MPTLGIRISRVQHAPSQLIILKEGPLIYSTNQRRPYTTATIVLIDVQFGESWLGTLLNATLLYQDFYSSVVSPRIFKTISAIISSHINRGHNSSELPDLASSSVVSEQVCPDTDCTTEIDTCYA